MLAIATELLTGRYVATSFNRWDEAEWPPHPARLFSALVAAWADDDEPDPVEREVLTWLEALGTPAITCTVGEAVGERVPVVAFVPVNDASSLRSDQSKSFGRTAVAEAAHDDAVASGDPKAMTRASKALEAARRKASEDGRKAGAAGPPGTAAVERGVLGVVPEHRSKQARWFPSVTPDDEHLWFVWPEADPSPEQRAALDRLCARVGRLGHSSSLVSCRVESSDVPPPTLVPRSDGSVALRVPRAGLLDRLDEAFEVHQGREHRILPEASSFYGPPEDAAAAPPAPLLGGDWIVFGVPRRIDDPPGAALTVAGALEVARAVRGALLRHGDQPAPEVLSGHRPADRAGAVSAPSDRPHVAVVPLPDVSHEHSDGVVLGVALVLPTDLGDDDRAAVERAVTGWSEANGREVRFGPSGNGVVVHLDPPRWQAGPGSSRVDPFEREGGATVQRRFWCRPSREWVTATPVALDRFPGDLHAAVPGVRDEAHAAATATVARACVLAGLPAPSDVVVGFDGFLRAVPPAGSRRGNRRRGGFPPFKAGTSGQVRMVVHARLTFDEPVAGPVLLGAGRFLGYGLCLPILPVKGEQA